MEQQNNLCKICGRNAAVVFEEVTPKDEKAFSVGACADEFCLQRFNENLDNGLFSGPFDGEETRGFEL